jgi:uncharacterized membrane protein
MAPARSFNKSKRARFAAICALAAALFAAPVPHAQSQQAQRPAQGWSVCNETSYVLEAATGRPDGRAIVVQGWVRLRPGECRIAIGAPLARGTHSLYARTSSAHRGGRRQWGGEATLCVDPADSFQIENPPQCQVMALEERRFRRVQINKRDSWRTSFAEAQPYTLSRARAAGVQRLLIDSGYDIREGRSGVDPRQVAQAVQQFRASARLEPGASEDQLIDALENAARRRSEQLGLTLCNRTRGRVWTAMARLRGEGWESRGWWQLGANGCVRALDEPLLQDAYFVYAAMESPEGERLLAAGGEPFCTSPARFAILGREDCDDHYYDTTLFTRISARSRDGMIVELEERDFLPAGENSQSNPAEGAAENAPESGPGGARPNATARIDGGGPSRP